MGRRRRNLQRVLLLRTGGMADTQALLQGAIAIGLAAASWPTGRRVLYAGLGLVTRYNKGRCDASI